MAEFTLEEKVNITTGVGWMGGRCVGNIPAVGDFPGLCLEDSPLGVRRRLRYRVPSRREYGRNVRFIFRLPVF